MHAQVLDDKQTFLYIVLHVYNHYYSHYYSVNFDVLTFTENHIFAHINRQHSGSKQDTLTQLGLLCSPLYSLQSV